MQILKIVAIELAIIGSSLHNDDLMIHILNGLGSKYGEVIANMRSCDTPIPFKELHDKLGDYETFKKR